MPTVQRSVSLAIAIAALALAALAPSAGAAPAGGVLVVGDSLEELSSPYLAKFLPGVPLRINAVGGSNSYQIFDLFQESYEPSQRVIVFDAGTNDNPGYPQILAANLAKVAAAVGTGAWWCRRSTDCIRAASTTAARTGSSPNLPPRGRERRRPTGRAPSSAIRS
jgi:hypothetical protein